VLRRSAADRQDPAATIAQVWIFQCRLVMRLLEPYGRAGAMLALMTVTTEPVGGPSVVTPAIPSGRAALTSAVRASSW